MDYNQASPGTGLMVTGAGTATIIDNSSKLKCKYICGGCGKMNQLDAKSQVRCNHCGYRIFYKLRTSRLTQFEAR
jgi:DNA-directed RNA polymerases I, II, and III subunit RPABC4